MFDGFILTFEKQMDFNKSGVKILFNSFSFESMILAISETYDY